MLYLKPANFDDLEKQHTFVAAEPADENGFLNDYNGISLEDFKSTALPRMIDFSVGKNLPEGFVPETFYFLWRKGMLMIRLITKLSGSSGCVII